MRFGITFLLLIALPSVSVCQSKVESAAPGIHDYLSVDAVPVPKNLGEVRKQIGYPVEAIKAGIEGVIHTRVLVDEKGNYVSHRITRKQHPLLNEVVNLHIHKLKFIPARKSGKKVKYWMNVSFKFENSPREVKQFMTQSITQGVNVLHSIKSKKKSDLFMESGVKNIELGRWRDALTDFTRSIVRSPHNKTQSRLNLIESLMHRGNIYQKLGQHDNACKDFTEAIGFCRSLNKTTPHADSIMPYLYYSRGLSYMANKNPLYAINDFQWIRKYYKQWEMNDSLYFKQAKSYFLLNQPDSAISCFQKARAMGIASNSIYFYESMVWMHKGDFMKSLNTLQEGLDKLQPEDPKRLLFLTQKGRILNKVGAYEAALNCLQEIIDEDPQNASAHLFKAETLFHLKSDKNACEIINKALEGSMEPSHVSYAKKLKAHYCGQNSEIP